MSIAISIIVPVYNAGEFLFSCIESIERNTFKDYEIIIVDDGSEKFTADICDNCLQEFSNVSVYHTVNQGVSAARNYGIQMAKGEFLTFVDADDTVDSNYLSELYNLAMDTGCQMAVVGHKEIFDNYTKERPPKVNKDLLLNNETKIDFLKNNISWNVFGKLFRRSILKDIKFPIGYCTAEDMFFLYQVCSKCKISAFSNKLVYNYNKVVPSSAMASAKPDKFFDTYKLLLKVKDEYCAINSTEFNYVKSFYISNSIWLIRFLLKKELNKASMGEVLRIRKEILDVVDFNTFKLLNSTRKLEIIFLKFFKNFYFLLFRKKVNKN